ncbi:MAG: putative membrane protein [Candidatus Marivariicella framensis]|jgi:uncharacterized membrane protein
MKYVKKLTIYLMAFFYAYAGINHFINPDYFLSIMPTYFPWQLEAVYISGFFEIIFGIGLLTRYRKYSAWGLIILLFAVFPANIYLIDSQDAQNALGITRQTAIIRAPFQVLFLGLAFWHSKT